MSRQQTMDALSEAFGPAQVWAYTDGWTFCIETTPATVLTISKEWAGAASSDQLRQVVADAAPGEYVLTFRGDLVLAKSASALGSRP